MTRFWVSMCALGLFISGSGASATDVKVADVKVLVPGNVMHAIEGIAFDNEGMLYGTSIHGQAVYRIDPKTGAVQIAVRSPVGESDDVAIGPAGTPAAGIIAWTAQRTGEIRIQRPGQEPEVILRNVPRVNPIAFNAEGRLFTAQVGAGEDTLWELDVITNKPPRVVTKNKGQLNGFGFGPDGRLYAPQFRTDKLVAIDVDTGEVTTIASNVGAPAAAKVDSNGDVISVDYLKGNVWRTNVKTGASNIFATLREPIDNLAFDKDGTIFISNVADSTVFAVDPKTGASRNIVPGFFSVALGMSMAVFEGRELILVADPFGYRTVDPTSGAVERPFWAGNRGASTAVVSNERLIAFTYSGSGRVRVIDRRTDQVAFETTALKAARGLALTSTDDVIVADVAGNRIVKVTRDGITDLATGLRQPVGLMLESDTVALVTEIETGTIARVDLVTGTRTEIAKGLQSPTALARMKDGRLAVVEPPLKRVVALDLESGGRTELASGLALGLDDLDLPLNTTAGVAVASDGTIYVSCPGDNSIVKISLK